MGHEILLENGLVVTVDDLLGDFQDADVLSRDGVIIALGSGMSTSTTDAEVMDCKAVWSSLGSSTLTATFGRERSAP
jgi:predicted amidohydrolase YtcJ